MIENLLKLKKKLAEWAGLTAEEQAVADKAGILSLIGEVKDEFLVSLDACNGRDLLQLKFNQYYFPVVRILNQCPWPQEFGTALLGLLDELEVGRPGLLYADEPLPRHEKEKLEQLADQCIPIICMAIIQKKLPATYCNEIKSAVRALFDDNKLPVLTYHHRTYIPKLINEGLQLASDKASSRWKAHLLEIFVNLNFNFMGIYNRWKELRDAEFEAAEKTGTEDKLYDRWVEIVSHYNPRPGMAFDPDNDSLLSHMERYLKLRKKPPGKKKKKQNIAGMPAQLFSKLVWGALAVRFHYFFPTDYEYEDLPEAVDDFINVHVSKTGTRVKPRLFIKFDKEKLQKPAREFYFLLGKIRKRMESEFGFRPTDEE